MPILIKKVSEPYGWLGNMSAFELFYNEKTYKTSEALFQCLRFDNQEVIDLIISQKSPMSAKMIAKKHKDKMIIKPQSQEDLDNMNLVLNLKISQHNHLLKKLIDTKNDIIIEDCTKRPRGSGLFWGAALINSCWEGNNWLGKIWMNIRDSSI